MKASLIIEAIGHDQSQRMRLYGGILYECGLSHQSNLLFADIDSLERWGVWDVETGKKIFGKTDYSHANSKGSRGVRVHYLLDSGKHYLVKSPKSWRSIDVYLCHVNEKGEIIREKTIGD